MTHTANGTFLKKLLLTATALAMLLSMPALAKDDDKTGYEKDDIFHDNRYGYSFQLPDDWKVGKTYDDKDERSLDRVIIYRKKFRVPVKLQSNRELVQRPTTIILIDSTTLAPAALFQQVTGSHELDAFGEAIVSRSILLQRAVQTPAQVTESVPYKIGEMEGMRWKVRLEYAHQLETQFGPQLVRDWKVGNIFIVNIGGALMYIEQVCENQSYDSLTEELGLIVSSMKFPSSDSADSTSTMSSEKSEGK